MRKLLAWEFGRMRMQPDLEGQVVEENVPRRVIVFALHKTASMFIYEISKSLASRIGLPFFSPNGESPLDLYRTLVEPTILLARGVYAPIRAAVEVPDPQGAAIVVHLRDPRDALVSLFYSYCFGHVGQVPGGSGFRAAVAERGIDQFVLECALSKTNPLQSLNPKEQDTWELVGNFRDRYHRLLALADRWPEQVTVVHYETMVTRFAEWLRPFAGAFGVRDEQTIAELVREFGRTKPPAVEDPYSHRRRVLPGDYLEKLRPETIEVLTREFGLGS